MLQTAVWSINGVFPTVANLKDWSQKTREETPFWKGVFSRVSSVPVFASDDWWGHRSSPQLEDPSANQTKPKTHTNISISI